MSAPERCRKPVIAAIDGYTMGAGLELAVACDFRIATLRSEFAFPEVRLGMIPGSGGTQRALRLMGITRGKLFMMTGRRIPAATAEAWGLITQAVADDGEWVCGKLWDPSLFPDAPALDRDVLDRLVPRGPAIVVNASMHFAYLNTAALAAIELHDDSPDPPGGVLGRRDGRAQAAFRIEQKRGA